MSSKRAIFTPEVVFIIANNGVKFISLPSVEKFAAKVYETNARYKTSIKSNTAYSEIGGAARLAS